MISQEQKKPAKPREANINSEDVFQAMSTQCTN